MFKKLNLLSRTEMKLLGFISVRDGELYERQIADGAGVSAGSANAILRAFARLGLLRRSRKGRMLFYRRNDDNPLLRQFKVLSTVNDLMPAVGGIAPLCTRVVLFGSCAVGRNGEGSDIDLLVVSGEKERVRAALAMDPAIRAIVLDSDEFVRLQSADKPLYDRMMAGIELWGGELG